MKIYRILIYNSCYCLNIIKFKSSHFARYEYIFYICHNPIEIYDENFYEIKNITNVDTASACGLDEDTEESVNDMIEVAETKVGTGSKLTFKIKKIESGERAWLLCEDSAFNKNEMNRSTFEHRLINRYR